VAVAAVALLLSRWRWQLVAAVWALFCVAGSLMVVLLTGGERLESEPDKQPGSETPWGRKTLLSFLPLVVAMPCLLVVSRLLSWLLLGDVLAALNPGAVDPEAAFGLLFLDLIWVVPAGVVFAARSFRRGRLGTVRDLGVAAGAWMAFLFLRELLLQGGFGVLESQLIGGIGFDDWGAWQAVAVWSILAGAALPVTLYLAWGRSWDQRAAFGRLAVVSALMLGALLNLAVLVGSNGQMQFVTGRILERSGHPERALSWYARSFAASNHQGLEAYLQHRIGLLLYKQGDVERAANAFTQLTTGDAYHPALVAEGNHYLERLQSKESDAGRVVLPGVEVRSERRRSYCAPNTLALVLGFLGRPVGVAELGEEATLLGAGTSGSDICFLLEHYGFEQLLVPFATIDDLRWLIDRGLPALVYTPGHVLAVVGYDDRLGTAVCYDTAKWDIWVDRPYAELEADWGQDLFLMGVVLPMESGEAHVREARERYGGARARAARQWWLHHEEPGTAASVARLKRAVRSDPSFFPAIFDLLSLADWAPQSEGVVEWLQENADGSAAVAEATELLGRAHADAESVASGLARWHDCCGSSEELVRLALELSRRGEFSELRAAAGTAAQELGQWERTAFLLKDLAYESPEAMASLAIAHARLGQEDLAAATFKELVGQVSDDRLEEALEQARSLAPGRGPGFLEHIYRTYSYWRPGDVEVRLQLAELSLEALSEDPDGRAERLQQVRAAATTAWALAEDEPSRSRAQELLSAARDAQASAE
jgi:tetratricopeptide (TPR) repeat protein